MEVPDAKRDINVDSNKPRAGSAGWDDYSNSSTPNSPRTGYAPHSPTAPSLDRKPKRGQSLVGSQRPSAIERLISHLPEPEPVPENAESPKMSPASQRSRPRPVSVNGIPSTTLAPPTPTILAPLSDSDLRGALDKPISAAFSKDGIQNGLLGVVSDSNSQVSTSRTSLVGPLLSELGAINRGPGGYTSTGYSSALSPSPRVATSSASFSTDTYLSAPRALSPGGSHSHSGELVDSHSSAGSAISTGAVSQKSSDSRGSVNRSSVGGIYEAPVVTVIAASPKSTPAAVARPRSSSRVGSLFASHTTAQRSQLSADDILASEEEAVQIPATRRRLSSKDQSRRKSVLAFLKRAVVSTVGGGRRESLSVDNGDEPPSNLSSGGSIGTPEDPEETTNVTPIIIPRRESTSKRKGSLFFGMGGSSNAAAKISGPITISGPLTSPPQSLSKMNLLSIANGDPALSAPISPNPMNQGSIAPPNSAILAMAAIALQQQQAQGGSAPNSLSRRSTSGASTPPTKPRMHAPPPVSITTPQSHSVRGSINKLALGNELMPSSRDLMSPTTPYTPYSEAASPLFSPFSNSGGSDDLNRSSGTTTSLAPPPAHSFASTVKLERLSEKIAQKLTQRRQKLSELESEVKTLRELMESQKTSFEGLLAIERAEREKLATRLSDLERRL